MTTKWCVECDAISKVHIDLPTGKEYHVCMSWDHQEYYCTGPFETSAPPVLEPDWEMHVAEPFPYELMEMDAHAWMLISDLK